MGPDVKSYRRYVTGKRNRASGLLWEDMIMTACKNYRLAGVAEIEKTPESMRPLSRPNAKGQFIACFTKKAQPDYKGTLKGGRAVVFEAKHTDGDRIERSVLTEEQEKALERHYRLGALCFVLVSFGFKKYFRIPWDVFRDMQTIYGRKYIRPEEMGEHAIKHVGGFLRFL